jgi:hypothetical protein
MSFTRSAGGGCLMRAVISIVVPIAFVVSIGGAFGLVSLVGADTRTYTMPLGLLAFFGFMGVFVTLLVVVLQRRLGSALDGAMRPLGFEDMERLGPASRGWAGQWKGRRTDIYVTKGPMLELFVTVDGKSRLGIGTSNVLSRNLVGENQKIEMPAQLEGLLANAAEPGWAHPLIHNEQASQAIHDLVLNNPATLRALTVTPGYVTLKSRYLALSEITAERVEGWLDALTVLADTIEATPEPDERVEASSTEQRFGPDRRDFMKSTWKLMALIGCMTVLVILCMSGAIVLLAG